jgi:hypothetical protein
VLLFLAMVAGDPVVIAVGHRPRVAIACTET